MSITIYSFFMAVIWFSLSALIGSLVLRKESTQHGLVVIALFFLLALIRMFVPLDLTHSVVIPCKHVYPALQGWIRKPLAGRITPGICLLLIWAVGGAIQLLRLGWKLKAQRKFRQYAVLQEKDSLIGKRLSVVCNRYGFHGKVYVAVSPNVTTAYQAGFLHPYILMPAHTDTFDQQGIDHMLQHELCHFLGGDLWIIVLLRGVCCIFWWNPVLPMLIRSVEQMLELRCDKRVCKNLSEEQQLTYLDTLLQLAEMNRKGETKIPQISMGYTGKYDAGSIVQRFQIALHGSTNRRKKVRAVVCCAMCFVLFCASYFVILQPWSPPAENPAEQEVTITPETAYIVRDSDGVLGLYYEGVFYATLTEEAINYEPFNELTIYGAD